MSHEIVLFGLLKSTFALLLKKEDIGQNGHQLVIKLDTHIQQLRKIGISNEHLTSLSHLKSASVCLRSCFPNLKATNKEPSSDNSDNESKLPERDMKQQKKALKENDQASRSKPGNTASKKRQNDLNDKDRSLLYTPKDAKLQQEVQEMKASDKFEQAKAYFQQSNAIAGTVFWKGQVENETETKIRATKVLVISEILGNLTDLCAAMEKCKTYISKLHDRETLNTGVLKNALDKVSSYWSSTEDMDSIIHINGVVYSLMKEFIKRPVVVLDWPSIVVEGSVSQQYHPVLGEILAAKFVLPSPFTDINKANKAKLHIDPQITAVNCCGEIFANCKVIEEGTETLTGIIRITTSIKRRYGFDDKLGRKILSISIDCTGCETTTEPSGHCGEASTQSSVATNCSQELITCNGKMYILALCKRVENFCCYLYIIDMEGNVETREELGFLERRATEVLQVKVFCVRDKKIIILDVARRIIYICDNKGKHIDTVNVSRHFSHQISTIAYSGAAVCLEGRRKLSVYDIINQNSTENPPISKPREIEIKYNVQAVAYNHKSGEFTVLCYATNILTSKQYHLATYTKDGELQQDIKQDNTDDKYGKAILISHSNGPMVLLDKDKFLHLKMV